MASATSSSGKTNGIVDNGADAALAEQDVDVEGEEFEGSVDGDEDGEDEEYEEDEYDVDDEVCWNVWFFCSVMKWFRYIGRSAGCWR